MTAVLLLAAVLGVVAPRPATAAAEDATIAFNFQDVELGVLARFVSEVTGRNFIVDDRVRGRVTIVSPTRIDPAEALLAFQSALQVKGFTTVESGAFTKIVPIRDARGAGDPTVVTRILRLVHGDVEALLPVLEPLMSADGVLRAYPPRNSLLVVDTGANVARLAALVRDLDRPSPPGDIRLHVVPLRHADADQLARVLAQLLGLPPPPPPAPTPQGSSFMRRRIGNEAFEPISDGPLGTTMMAAPASTGDQGAVPLEGPVRLTADPATNTLVVSASTPDWATLEPVVRALDVRRRQVFVEAIIVEASLEKSRSLGVEFQTATDTGEHGLLSQANLGTLTAAGTNPTAIPGLLLAAASNEQVTLPDGRSVPAHQALLTALETDGELNVLSAPNIVTTDNEEAEIIVGRNVPFVTGRSTTVTDPQNLFTTVVRQDVGITLRMRPQITGDDFVRLAVFEEVSDIDASSAAIGDPAIVGPTTTVRAASTSVAARDGQTVVIGGLLADTIRRDERRIPFLGRIPVLGVLFRRTEDRRVKTNLLVFLTPHIIATDRQMAERADIQRRRLPPDVRTSPAIRERAWGPPHP